MAAPPHSVLLVDDSEPFRRAMAAAFTRDARFGVVLEAAGAREAIAAIDGSGPDVVMCDVSLPPGADGFAVLAHARGTGVRVVMASSDPEHAAQARREGAAAFIDKALPRREIVDLIAAVATGGRP